MKSVVGQHLAVDGDTLVDLLQMRRRVQAGAHTVGAADGLGHACGGAFAVGAGDMNHAERLLRVAQDVEHQASSGRDPDWWCYAPAGGS